MNLNATGLSYLDAIRPDEGWEVDMALATSYSSDLVVLVAAMLALAGLDDERGSGSKVDFASAHEQLCGRVSFLVQAGRMRAPKIKPAILGIMDRFVCLIKTDERHKSWHPKISLIRYIHLEQHLIQWRFWIGSRNLSRGNSWDLGLLLVGNPKNDGARIPGIAEAGEALTKLSDLGRHTPATVRRELENTTWDVPKGIVVRSVDFRHGNKSVGLPEHPAELTELLVVSPFLDGRLIQRLGKWGGTDTKRLLLSTRAELVKLLGQRGCPTSAFQQPLFMDVPEPEDQTSEKDPEDEGEQLLRGLHAKLICAKTPDGGRIWMGSANATIRGWEGGNSEAITELDVSSEVYDQLRKFVEGGTLLEIDEQDAGLPDPRKELLEEQRKAICASWEASLEIVDGVPVLSNPVSFAPMTPGIDLRLGLITSDLVICPPSTLTLRLPAVAEYQLTEFVEVRLSLGDLHATWVQKAKFSSLPFSVRDQRALAHHLNPRVFLEWIRSLLHPDVAGDGGGDWDDETTSLKGRRKPPQGSAPWWAPSLEEILRAWSRNPNSVFEVDKKLKAYVRFLVEQHRDDDDTEDLKLLREFSNTWEIVRRELIVDSHHG